MYSVRIYSLFSTFASFTLCVICAYTLHLRCFRSAAGPSLPAWEAAVFRVVELSFYRARGLFLASVLEFEFRV